MAETFEHCEHCGDPTGRAGRADDSLFVELQSGEVGPLCTTCYKIFDRERMMEMIADVVEASKLPDGTAVDTRVVSWLDSII